MRKATVLVYAALPVSDDEAVCEPVNGSANTLSMTASFAPVSSVIADTMRGFDTSFTRDLMLSQGISKPLPV